MATYVDSLHPEDLKISKNHTATTKSQRINELTKESSILREQLARAYEIIQAWQAFYDNMLGGFNLVTWGGRMMQDSLQALTGSHTLADTHLSTSLGIDIDSQEIVLL